jgi:hypothetical protein
MMMQRTLVCMGLLAAVGATGCKNKEMTDNPDVAADYKNTEYANTIVTAKETQEYEDQGQGIDPITLSSIEDTIAQSYERDFSDCLEEEMDKHETRFLRSVFTVEFHINPQGDAGEARVLMIQMREQNAAGADLGERPPDELKQCIIDSIDEWEFDPAPEVEYVHTYNGQIGEAF